MTRAWFGIVFLTVLTRNGASQTRNAAIGGAPPGRYEAPTASAASPDSETTARLLSSDGRRIVVRPGISSGIVWLADSTHVHRDSSVFRIELAGNQLVVRDWLGRCLAATPRDARIPLTFGDCRRDSLVIEWVDAVATPSGERRFRLRTALGYVGPASGTAILFPRSDAELLFQLEPAGAP